MHAGQLETLLKNAPAKVYFEGTHRAMRPEHTWEGMRPLLPLMGITRLANVTGLDRIGIPVYMCCRPNSRSLAVSQGKGIDKISAKVSALMESVEAWHAEYNRCVVTLEHYVEMKRNMVVCDALALPFCKGSLFADRRPIPWVQGIDLLHREEMWVPYELVHANATLPAIPGSGCFVPSTNGLASGNTHLEATLHALYEIVERDALTLWELATQDRWGTGRIDCTTIDDPGCHLLLERYADAGISVMVWNISSDVGLPVFVVIICDGEQHTPIRPVAAAFGSGCHADRRIALSRALTEAAQSRLTAIAGSRDDLTRATYHASQSEEAVAYHQELARERIASVAFRDAPTFESASLSDDLLHVFDCLRRAAIERVVLVDLSRPDMPVAVVRAVVPGLEGPSESRWYRPGRRVQARWSTQ